MRTRFRRLAPLPAFLAAALLLSGCMTSNRDSGPTPTPAPETTPPATAPGGPLEVEGAWLDEGRMIAVVTWGSSTCLPVAEEVTASGQLVTVTLSEGDPNQPCTADYVPRASLVELPEGVDPKQDVQVRVTLADASGDTDLDGNPALTGVPGQPTTYAPTAGWVGDDALVLLTWGSSSCPPVVESVNLDGANGTVNFVTEDRPCTMDMAPRATLIEFGPLPDNVDDVFVLTLVGGGLDATLNVIDS